jgi:hypothetical protein
MDEFEQRLSEALREETGERDRTVALAAGARRKTRERRSRRRTTLGVVAVSTAVVAMVGGQVWSHNNVGEDPGPRGDELSAVLDPLVSCGGVDAWPVSAMGQGAVQPTAEKDARIRDAFAELQRSMPMDAPAEILERGALRADYVVLVDGSDELVLAVGKWSEQGPGPKASVLTLARDGDAWAAEGWGDCQLQIATPPGRDRVELTALEGGMDPASRTITVLASERQCSGGRDVTPYLSVPEIEETDRQVSVMLTSGEVTGNALCIGNRPVEVEIELAEPLGDRELVDGGAWPPAPLQTAERP